GSSSSSTAAKNASRSRCATSIRTSVRARPAALLRRFPGVKRLALVLLAAILAGCGTHQRAAVKAKAVVRCKPGAVVQMRSASLAYAGVAANGAAAYDRPRGKVAARFGKVNVNDYPTIFGVLGKVVTRGCKASWYRVQLPMRPNGKVGYVRPWRLQLVPIRARI